jgi:hypothetical protein
MIAQAGDLGPHYRREPLDDTAAGTPGGKRGAAISGIFGDPGHWIWDGAQYVWQSLKIHCATHEWCDLHSGYWQEYSRGWAW